MKADEHLSQQPQVVAKNVRMGAADVGGAPGDDAGGFGTDAAISRGRSVTCSQQGPEHQKCLQR